MPGTTPGGYPYAEPTDPLVQWPATSQSLANKLDPLATRDELDRRTGVFTGESADANNYVLNTGEWRVLLTANQPAGSTGAGFLGVRVFDASNALQFYRDVNAPTKYWQRQWLVSSGWTEWALFTGV